MTKSKMMEQFRKQNEQSAVNYIQQMEKALDNIKDILNQPRLEPQNYVVHQFLILSENLEKTLIKAKKYNDKKHGN